MVRKANLKTDKKPRSRKPAAPPVGGFTFDFGVEWSADERGAQDRFLRYFNETTNIGKACLLSDVRRDRHVQWLASDPEYAARYDNIKQQKVDEIEDVPAKIALDEKQPAQARLAAAKLVLEAERPEKYRKGGDSDGSGEVHINIILGKKPQQELPPTVEGSIVERPALEPPKADA